MNARAILPVLFALLLVSVIYALSNPDPSWTPAVAFKNTTINCSWSTSADTLAQNITLLRNGLYFSSSYENASDGPLSNSILVLPSSFVKGDKWTCRITSYNDTASLTQDTNISILNSPPTTEGYPAGIFNISGQDIGYLVRVGEHEVLQLDVNATDADGDTLNYLQADAFCTRTSNSQGTYTCAPAQSDLVDNKPTLINITFTVTDGQNVGGRTITFNVTPYNDAPRATLAAQATQVNKSLTYTFGITDEESNTPYSAQVIAAAEIADKFSVAPVSPDGSLMRFTYDGTVPDFKDIGLWNISINITDNSTDFAGANDSRSAVYSFALNITPVGRAPFFTNITPTGIYSIAQGQFLQINVSANDPDANSTLTFLVGTNRFNITTIVPSTNASDAQGQINFTPANGDVGLYNVTLTVRDATTLTNTTILQFNVSNVNDPPVIYEMSSSPANTQANVNASNLTAYSNTQFIYNMNATDPDLPYGDLLTFTSNSTLVVINASSGRIAFTPTDSDVQTGYAVNITVRDAGGLQYSRLIMLDIRANSPPYFNASLQQMNCTTKSACSLVLGGSTADRDAGDYVAAYTISVSGNLTSFAYNASTGLINFTPAKTEIGNYTLNITISDTHGATNSTSVALIINNTPEAPNLTRYGFGAETIVETHLFAYELWATDDDLLISVGENVTFTTNLTLAHTITPLASANNTAKALLTFTPDIGTAGRYSVRINATDRFGLVGSRVVDFVVYPKVPPPNITSITPWGLGALTHDLQTSYISTDNVIFGGGRVAQVNLGENTTVLFNLVVNDTRPVTYSWTVNGTQVSTSSSYSREFDFFSAGRYTVSILVANDRLENSSWTWDLTVTDVNRPPVLKNNLTSPLSANGTVVYATYFTLNNGTKFIDPDDDLNSNGIIDGDEASTLTFSANSACSAATLSAVGSDLKIAGVTIGSCAVTFNATDAHGATAESNLVGINVTGVPTGESPAPTVTSTGGGGSSSTTSTFIPLNKKVDTPKAFSIIAPKLVTVYSNKSVTIPITINNTWNAPLKMLRLTAQTNASGVRTAFDTDFFEEIGVNQSKEVTLTVTNYRLGSNYEILVKANVSDPKYEDQALVLLNSIEQAQDGSDVSVKVTFANDLLNEHPECQELNEVLSEAKKKIADGDLKEGEQLVTSVIDGCKYLVSTQQRIQEKPTRLNPIININDLSVKAIMLGVLAFVVLSSIAFLIYYHYTHKPEDDI